ncbi:MAG: hypothetical protein AAFY60_01435, partial [Myxococcota bacterium]
VDNNLGDGIVMPRDEGPFETRLRATGGTVTITNNRGHGVRIEGGHFRSRYASVSLSGNCGWGALLNDGHFFAFGNGGEFQVSSNGTGDNGEFWTLTDSGPSGAAAPCGGGGIGITDASAETTSVDLVLENAMVAMNRGPGVATTVRARVFDAVISGNEGPGIVFADLDGTSPDSTAVNLQGSTEVSDNLGSGVELESGSFRAQNTTLLIDNAGAGVECGFGNAAFNLDDGGISTVRRNGLGALMCRLWTLDAGTWSGAAEAPCTRNEGVFTEEGNIDGRATIIRDNGGAGVSASDPDMDGLGVVTIDGGQLCDNGAPNVATADNLTNMSCP